jgi:hypothetical protein
MGLTYPEEAHDDTVGRPPRRDFIEIPDDWRRAGLTRIPADPAIDDRFIVSIQQYTGDKMKAIETKVLAARKKQIPSDKGTRVRWTDADWWCFAKAYNLNLFMGQYNNESALVRITKFYNMKSPSYAVALYINGPELLLSAKKPLKLGDLPPIFRSFMDSGFASDWESVKGTVS